MKIRYEPEVKKYGFALGEYQRRTVSQFLHGEKGLIDSTQDGRWLWWLHSCDPHSEDPTSTDYLEAVVLSRRGTL